MEKICDQLYYEAQIGGAKRERKSKAAADWMQSCLLNTCCESTGADFAALALMQPRCGGCEIGPWAC